MTKDDAEQGDDRKAVLSMPPGVPVGDTEFISQTDFDDPDASFCVTLPGGVLDMAGSRVGAVIPSVNVVLELGAHDAEFGTGFHFGAADPEATEEAFDGVAESLAEGEWVGFSLIAESDDSVASVLGGAQRGAISREQPLAMRMQASFLISGLSKPVLSRTFPVLASVSHPDYELRYQDGFGPIFTCHSHWFTEPLKKKNRRNYTICHGPCSGSLCHPTGTPGTRFGWGWSFCWC